MPLNGAVFLLIVSCGLSAFLFLSNLSYWISSRRSEPIHFWLTVWFAVDLAFGGLRLLQFAPAGAVFLEWVTRIQNCCLAVMFLLALRFVYSFCGHRPSPGESIGFLLLYLVVIPTELFTQLIQKSRIVPWKSWPGVWHSGLQPGPLWIPFVLLPFFVLAYLLVRIRRSRSIFGSEKALVTAGFVLTALLYANDLGLGVGLSLVPARLSDVAFLPVGLLFAYSQMQPLSRNHMRLESLIRERTAALKESEEYNKVLFRESRVPMVVIDPASGRYTDCNEAAVRIYAYPSREAVLGKTPVDFSASVQYDGAPSAAAAQAQIAAALNLGSHTFPWRHRRPDGEEWDAEVNLMRLSHGGRTWLLFTLQDISRRLQAERRLRESEAKFKTLFESASDAIFIMNREVFLDCNRRTEEIFGCRRQEIVGQSPVRFSPPLQPDGRSSVEKAGKHIESAFAGQPQFFDWMHTRLDGAPFPAEVSLNRFSLGGQFFLQAIVRDVSDRVRAQQEREKIQAQLIQAQKMEALGTLTSGLAHDFNNLLGGIMGSLDLIELGLARESVGRREGVAGYLETARNSGLRAASMIRQLLAISRKSEMRLVSVGLNRSLANVQSVCQNSFPKSVRLDFRPSWPELRVLGDPTQVEQVLLNLCVNASHAMTVMRAAGEREGGTLTVTLAPATVDEALCRAHPEADGSRRYAHLEIVDDGVGMGPQVLGRIFEPFFTTKKQAQGSGLGLAVALGIVQQLGGFIHVESEPGMGTRVGVYLPAMESMGGDVAEPLTPVALHRGSGVVLVVDDEISILHVAKGILEASGYEVLAASSPAEAIEIFKEKHTGIDLVLLDVSLPGMSGFDLLPRLRAIEPRARVLLNSGFADEEKLQAAMREGQTGFIAKPYSARDLSFQINRMLAKGG